jgi:NADH-quinone oxidoreductase subunit I
VAEAPVAGPQISTLRTTPKVRVVNPVRTLSLVERLYLREIIRGLGVTTFRFWRNLTLHILHALGFARGVRAAVTVQYPEEQKEYPWAYRGSHRLTIKDDGSVRCTACFLCATACPARCIHIEAGEHPDPEVEKFPLRYEIDTLRCIYCGMCVEACPCDAIRMDTYVHPRMWGYRREDFIESKEVLMGRSRTLASRGQGSLLDDLLREQGGAS